MGLVQNVGEVLEMMDVLVNNVEEVVPIKQPLLPWAQPVVVLLMVTSLWLYSAELLTASFASLLSYTSLFLYFVLFLSLSPVPFHVLFLHL